MNRALTRRLLNEYLDGEIGLADKIELERMMAADPELRKEYQELRRVSLLLGSQPEIIVHPSRFRQKMMNRLSSPQRLTFTPQRAFAGAMLVALMVITMTFALVMYQEKLLGGWQTTLLAPKPASVPSGDSLKIYVPAAPEAYFDRLLLETQLGMLDPSALAPFVAQTNVYEGAICRKSRGLRTVRFARPLPEVLRINVTTRQAEVLHEVALEMGDGQARLMQFATDGSELPAEFAQFNRQHNSGEPVRLYIEFE